jgi:uncharacterized protein (TIGR03086 family)
MAAEPHEQAISVTRGVLVNVSKEQLDDATPCAQWKVSDLVNHIVGGQYFFAAGASGAAPSGKEVDYSSGDFMAAFDEGTRQSLAAFRVDGVMDQILTLPFGQMPGSAFLGLAATDTFTHGWDLARATGQDTDLAPELATQLLAGARMAIQPAFRSEDGAVFGLEQTAPAGASNADQLAAFLGRRV